MRLSPYLLTTAGSVDVVSETTSGEVEYVLLRRGTTMWLTVGSDQTDRDIETKSIVASKQMCGKYVAGACWPFDDVAGHWDQLVLRCWVTKNGHRTLYQDAPLGCILRPAELIANAAGSLDEESRGTVIFSGTVATTGGLIFGDAYELELADPVLQRTIRGAYRVNILPQLV